MKVRRLGSCENFVSKFHKCTQHTNIKIKNKQLVYKTNKSAPNKSSHADKILADKILY